MNSSLPFTILPAGLRDLMDLRRLESACFQDDAWPLLDLLAVLVSPGVVRIKAVAEARMVGFAAGDPRPREGMGWITTICTDAAYRGQGIATAMLDICEQRMGLPRVRLCVRRSNDDAIRLYQRRGYRQISVWSNYYSGGEDALLMEKVVAERLFF